MRSVGSNDKWQVGNLAQRLHVDRHAAKRSLEGIDCRTGNPAHLEVMCWPDQHNTRDRLRTVPERCECRGSNAAGIGIPRVRRDQRFWHALRHRHIGEQVQNLCSQEIRITGVEQACHRCRPSSRIRLHLALLSSDHHF